MWIITYQGFFYKKPTKVKECLVAPNPGCLINADFESNVHGARWISDIRRLSGVELKFIERLK